LGILLPVFRETLEPCIAQILASLANPVAEVIVNSVWYVEFLVFRPSVIPFRETNLLFSQGLAVSAACILFVGRAVPDVTVDDDQRRPVIRVLERAESAREHFQVIGVAYPC